MAHVKAALKKEDDPSTRVCAAPSASENCFAYHHLPSSVEVMESPGNSCKFY